MPADQETDYSKDSVVLLCSDGIMQNYASFVMYCIAMYDYDMNVYDLFCVILKVDYPHNPSDV